MKRVIPILLAALLCLTCCAAEGKMAYTQVSQDEAKSMMEQNDGYVIVDVRRQDEYDSGHIPGSILVPNESIGTEPPEQLPDKDQIILVYCRSGRRSKESAQKLADMGYTNVYEFGGIIDWTGEITTDAPDAGTGLFSQLIETDCFDERLERLDEIAEPISLARTEGGVTVEVCQAYFEGNRVYISYRADGLIFEEDGLELEDGAYADIMAGGSVRQEDGSIIGWRECIVPEDELADSRTFCLVYSIPGNDEKQSLKVPLKHNEYDRFLQGLSPAADCQARAILYTGKVDLKGTVVLISPEQAASWIAWQEGEEETGTDVIACWNLYQNGELVSCDLSGASEVLTDGVVFSVMFPYMEDLSGLTLVPEYSAGGEKPDEAIPLELMTGNGN